MIGKVISRYRILEKLGAGGMGEVYLAEDSDLDRKIALKFLPSQFTEDPEISARFKHEAKAAAALNHTNIITIHDVGEHEGTAFIAMEYVQGRSLRDVLDKEELSLSKLIDIASQICEGLSEAHQAGIVHRDIKPENILIDTKGRVKIADFGLAKLRGRTKLTEEGSTLGTLEYMSPEQLRGEDVDHRSDIWSMGAVLYEMITGQRPFKGEYDVALTYSIMHDTSEPLARYKTGVSEGLQHIIDKALDKDKETRYQDIRDLLADLKREKRNASEPVKYATGLRKTHRAKKKSWFGLGAGVALAIASLALLLLRPHPVELNPDAVYRQLPTPFTEISSPGLSEDGNWVAFGAADAQDKWDVYLMNTSGSEPRCITSSGVGLAEIWNVQISPDGGQIVYTQFNPQLRESALHIVSSLGGVNKRIVEKGAFGANWRPDGERIGYIVPPEIWPGKTELWSVKPDGSDNHLEFVDSLGSGFSFSWSPDGHSVAWLRQFPDQEVFVRELATGKERQLTFDRKNIDDVLWTRRNEIIFSSDKTGTPNLWIIPARGGTTQAITKGAESVGGPQLSADGKKLLYVRHDSFAYLWIAKSDGTGAHQITFDERMLTAPRLSPDGSSLLFRGHDPVRLNNSHLYLMDRNGSNRQQLTFGDEFIWPDFEWSPDGHWIAYCSSPPNSTSRDSAGVYLLAVSNPAAPRSLGNGYRVWWIDSNTLIIGRGAQNWQYYVDGSPQQKSYQDSTVVFPFPKENYVLYDDWRKGREGWWIAPISDLDAPSAIPQRRILPATYVNVTPSGKFILYSSPDPGEVRKMSLPDGKDELFPVQLSGYTLRHSHASYDGKEVAYSDERSRGKLMIIENPFK